MTARRREFFEAFQNEGSRDQTSVPFRTSRPVKPAGSQKPGRTKSEDPRFYTIARDKAIAMGVALAALVVVAFFIGLSVGRRGDSPEPPPVDSVRVTDTTAGGDTDATTRTGTGERTETTVTRDTPAPASPRIFYKLQIVGGINDASARNLVAFLEANGYRPSLTRQNNRYTVYVGEFDSATSPDAIAFKDKFASMEYEGRRQFADCLFIRFEIEE